MLTRYSHHHLSTVLNDIGVVINGKKPYDPQIHDERTWRAVALQGTLGLGEAYMAGWWDCEHLDELTYRLLSSKHQSLFSHGRFVARLFALLTNRQSKRRAAIVGKQHYDVADAFCQYMLDTHQMYSCAYWRDTDSLDQAQRNKLDLIARKLDLQPGMSVVDVGCGWGGAAYYFAKQYGVSVLGITISQKQADAAKSLCSEIPNVTIVLDDYRNLRNYVTAEQRFDCAYSIGMFEHVGYKNYRTYMHVIHDILTDDGLFLLHTIGGNTPNVNTDAWINRYIFPNGMLPSPGQISRALEPFFVLEDWHNFGLHYDRTLMAWYERFRQHIDVISQQFDRRFIRMWTYYLLTCAGAFRARYNQLWQLLLSRNGLAAHRDIR